MGGTRLKALTLAAMLAIACGSARAADYPQPIPQPQPPPVVYQQPVVEEFSSGWYLRGDIGIGINSSYAIDYLPSPADVGNGFSFDQHSMADTFFIGTGVGYEWNNWLRFDATGEYRARTQINARGVYNQVTGEGDAYQGYLKSWVFLANAYVDLGTWNCFTPFVGVGIGAAHNQMADLVDMGIGTTGAGFGRNSSEWHPAWALHAGVAYNVTKNFKIELAYRYLNYGSVTDTVDCIGGCIPDSYKFSKLYSNDIKLGFRWTCCDVTPSERYVYTQQTYAPPPQVYTPPPVYSPPPPVYQPPLRSKG
jgi:opacity protein-like surface antigen